MNRGDWRAYLLQSRTVGLGGILLSVLALYGSSIDLKLFADDYISWTTVQATQGRPWWELFFVFYNPEFYRPLEHVLIRANMDWFGAEPVLYRWMTIVGHLLTVLAVYRLARRLRFEPAVALVAATFFGVSHANAMAVLSNDTASQVYSTLFGTIALTAMLRRRDDQPLAGRNAWAGAAWFLGALFWKDAGVSYAPALAVVLLWEWRRSTRRDVARLFQLGLPYLLVLAFYFYLRLRAGAAAPVWCGEGRYDLCLGWNVPYNLLLFLLGMITPAGSSIVVLRWHTQNWLFLTAWAGSLLVLGAVLVVGLRQRIREKPEDNGAVGLLLALLPLVMLPDVLMNQVSELYLYRMNTLLAVLLGLSVVATAQALWRRQRRVWLVAFAVFLAAVMWSSGKSIVHKTQRLRANGILTARLMNEIRAQLPTLPSRNIIVSNREPGPAPLYSIYYMEGIHVLGGAKIFQFYYGVKPETYRFYPFEQLDQAMRDVPGEKVVLLYRRDHVLAAVARDETNPFRDLPP